MAKRDEFNMGNLIIYGIIVGACAVIGLWAGYKFKEELKKRADSEKPETQVETSIKKDNQAQSQPDSDFFHVATTSMTRFKYPGPLLFFYNSQLGKTISPISIALFVEITNKRKSVTRVFSYRIRGLLTYDEGGEIIITTDQRGNQTLTYRPIGKVVTKWRELHSVGFLHNQIYYVSGDWTKAQRLDFSANGLDNIARDKQLQYGESIKGWVMLELEPDLRGQLPMIKELEFIIQNSAGESQSIKIPVAEKDTKYPVISSGAWHFMGGFHDLTTEPTTICPRIDVQELIKSKKPNL
jgi:hypothetical protein